MLVEDPLAPAPLRVFAEAIRDETWCDMRHIELGTIERVQITGLKLRRDLDEIECRQKWLHEEEVVTDEHIFDAEDIRWLRETGVALEDVKPLVRKPVPQLIPKDATYEALVLATIVDVICKRTGANTLDVLAGDNTMRKALYERQEAMWCLFEMTNLKPETIPISYFKYKSIMPLTTLRYRVESLTSTNPALDLKEAMAFRKWCLDTIKKTDAALGASYRRAPDQFSYWPTLKP